MRSITEEFMKKTMLGLMLLGAAPARSADLSGCQYQPRYNREDPPSQFTPLPTPLSFYLESKKEYFLAVDACQKSVMEAVGAKIREKPEKKTYSNRVGRFVGANSRSLYKNDRLNLIVYLEEDNTLPFMKSLGFEEAGNAESISDDESFGERMRVCIASGGYGLAPCATLSYLDRD
jgi:hypothetical protein